MVDSFETSDDSLFAARDPLATIDGGEKHFFLRSW